MDTKILSRVRRMSHEKDQTMNRSLVYPHRTVPEQPEAIHYCEGEYTLAWQWMLGAMVCWKCGSGLVQDLEPEQGKCLCNRDAGRACYNNEGSSNVFDLDLSRAKMWEQEVVTVIKNNRSCSSIRKGSCRYKKKKRRNYKDFWLEINWLESTHLLWIQETRRKCMFVYIYKYTGIPINMIFWDYWHPGRIKPSIIPPF